MYGSAIGSTKIVVQKGDILLSKLNPRIPRIWFINDEDISRRKLASTDFLALVVKLNSNGEPYFDTMFAKYFLLSNIFRSQVSQEIQGATNSRQRLKREDILGALLPRPRSLDIQRRIVDRIEALLADLRETQYTLESVRQDIDQVMDSAISEIFNDSVTASWQNRMPLRSLVAILAHQVDPQHSDYKQLPHIGGESIESKTCRIGTYHTAEEDQVTSGKYLFDPGVILYSKIRPYLRKVAIADFRGLCSADIYPLSVVSNDLLPRFLMWSMVAPPFTNYANTKSGRARMPKINREELFSYELPFPSTVEQQYIVNYLDSIQDGIDEIQETLRVDEEILQQVEQGILNQAFRGEL